MSMGTVFQIPWTYLQTENGVKNPPGQAAGADIGHLHRMGFRVAAMALSKDSVGIDDPALAAEEKLAVVLGTEGMAWQDIRLRTAIIRSVFRCHMAWIHSM